MKAKILSCGIIPIFKDAGGLKVLILRNYKNWDFPKGVLDKGEKPLEGARRELMEETGITEVSFPFGLEFVETEPYGAGKVARYYLGEVLTKTVVFGINPELGRAEHDEFRWVKLSEAETFFRDRLKLVLKWATEKLAAAKAD